MDTKYLTVIKFLISLWFICVLVNAHSGIEKRDVHRIIIKERRPPRSHRDNHNHHHHHHHKDNGYKPHKNKQHHHHESHESYERDRYPNKHGNKHHNRYSGERDHSLEDSSHYQNSHESSYEESPRHKPHFHRKPNSAEFYQSIEYNEPKSESYKDSSGWSPLISSENSHDFYENRHSKRNSFKNHNGKNRHKDNPAYHIELTTSYPQKGTTYHSYFDSTDFPPLFSFSNDNLSGKPSAPATVVTSYFPTASSENKKKNSYQVHENHKEDIFLKDQSSFNALVPNLSETITPLLGQSSKIKETLLLPKNKTITTNTNVSKIKSPKRGSKGRSNKTRT